MTPLDKAIQAFNGSQAELARAIGQSRQFISILKRRGGRLTTHNVSPDEWAKATGLPKSVLFPEYYD